MPKLVVEAGGQRGAIFNFRAKMAIIAGRGENADVQIEDSQASRRHFAVERRGIAYVLRDLGSTNGTFLNEHRVTSQQITPGDKIRVGQTVFCFRLDAKKAEPLVGQKVGGAYLVHQCVGAGGMGTVYMASQLSMDRVVALKILTEKFVKQKDFVTRFINEARAAGKLNHPNVVQVHDVGKADNIYFYSMEFMKGGSIQDILLRQKKISYDEAIPMIIDAARGLEFAESKGIVHKDIKPDNLMLTDDGTVKIADLGIAEMLAEGEKQVRSAVAGSPHYMSPEQATARPLDHRADIYSLGASFYRMVAGRTPFSGRTPEEIIRKALGDQPKPLKDFDVPRAVVQVIEKMMQKDPAERYQNSTVLIAALEKLRAMPKPAARSKERIGKRRIRAVRRRQSNMVPVFAAVGLILLLLLFIYLLSLRTPDGTDVGEARPERAGHPVKTSAKPNRMKDEKQALADARASFSRAQDYYRENPKNWSNASARYRKVVLNYPNTQVAREAGNAIKQIEKDKKDYLSEAEKSFVDAVKKAGELSSEGTYGEARDILLATSRKYNDTQWGTSAGEKASGMVSVARKKFGGVVKKGNVLITERRYEEARALYQGVIDNCGIPEIAGRATERMKDIGVAKAAVVKEAGGSLVKVDGLISSMAYSKALALLGNIPLGDLSDVLRASIEAKQEELQRLNAFKQKLVAAANKLADSGRRLDVGGGIRGSLLKADESAVTFNVREGKTVKPWDKMPPDLICALANDCVLVPLEHLVVGRMCLAKGAPELAIKHLKKASEDGKLRGESETLLRKAKAIAEDSRVLQAVGDYDKIMDMFKEGKFSDVIARLRIFMAVYSDVVLEQDPGPKQLIDQCLEKMKEERGERTRVAAIGRRHQSVRSKLLSKADGAAKDARRYGGYLEEARVLARFGRLSRSAAVYQKVVSKVKDKAPEIASVALCELVGVAAMAGRDVDPWFERAKVAERDAPERAGSAERVLKWASSYADLKLSVEEAAKNRDDVSRDASAEWELSQSYNKARMYVDRLASLDRIERDFDEDDRVKNGTIAWEKASTLMRMWVLDDALDAFDTFIEEFPEHKKAVDGSAEWSRADAYWRKGRRQQAYEAFVEFLRRFPRAAAWRKKSAQNRINAVLGIHD